jgi:hypothetical protein
VETQIEGGICHNTINPNTQLMDTVTIVQCPHDVPKSVVIITSHDPPLHTQIVSYKTTERGTERLDDGPRQVLPTLLSPAAFESPSFLASPLSGEP